MSQAIAQYCKNVFNKARVAISIVAHMNCFLVLKGQQQKEAAEALNKQEDENVPEVLREPVRAFSATDKAKSNKRKAAV